MARQKVSVFVEDIKDNLEELKIKVPKDFVERADNLNAALSEAGLRLKFDPQQILREAYKQAVIAGERELESRRGTAKGRPKKESAAKPSETVTSREEEPQVTA